MAVQVPTFEEIRTRVQRDFEAKLEASGATFGVVEYALAFALSCASYLLHIAIARAARNKVPTTAEGWVVRLWAAFFGVPPKTATKNVGTAVFPALAGTSIPAGSTLRLRNGIEFITDADADEDADQIEVAFTASVAGAAGRSANGVAIFLGSPIAGVTSEGAVPGGIAGGIDDESTASVLERLLDRLRNPPRGGTETDWIAWAKSTPNVLVRNVWIKANIPPHRGGLGPSSLLVLFTVDGDDPIPSDADEGFVTAHLQQFRPADLRVVESRAPTPHPIDPEIQISPDTLAMHNACDASLLAMLARDATPGGTVLLSRIDEAISTADGEVDHILVAPVANVVAPSEMHLVVLGTPTYSAL